MNITERQRVRRASAHDRPAVRVVVACSALLFPMGRVALGQPRAASCETCHADESRQFKQSVHSGAVRCQQCHGGNDVYDLTFEQWQRHVGGDAASSRPNAQLSRNDIAARADQTGETPASFDHGERFRGKTPRPGIPNLCGSCHADVERMNPYGLRTDQLASYWVSSHGKTLKQSGDARVAICIDCHGAHDVLRHDNPNSRTFFRNIPSTCGRCHEDRDLMAEYDLPATIVDEYRRSIHGRNVLDRGDAGSPNCATCHGTHAAAPPGYLEVGHVCGQCHKQIEEYFLSSVHGRIPVMARCVGCHAKGGKRWNHQIEEASLPVEELVALFDRIRDNKGDTAEALRASFLEEIDSFGDAVRLDQVCRNCHGTNRQDPHAEFFESSDQIALDTGKELNTALREVQFEYARTASRISRLGRGVLLVQDEALQTEDAKTELMALYASLHTLNRIETQTRAEKTKSICSAVNDTLDQKEHGLSWRRWALLPIWVFAVVFSVLMYQKFLALKRQYVRHGGQAAAPTGTVPLPGRRRLFDVVLSLMGAVTLFGLAWPAVAYILPARKRGGTGDRVAVGNESDWEPWASRKVSVGGKPVVVVRTDDGFRAYSAVCTHLGCIVHWNGTGRTFQCPCHAATFDATGQVVSGPPPRPLPEYKVSVAQGEVIVTGAAEG